MRRRSVGRWAPALLILVILVMVAGGLVYRYPLWFVDAQVRWGLRRAGVESRYVKVDGYRIHYFEVRPSGGGAETPLVLVHGLAARGEDWAPMIPALAAAGFHVYVPDLLGYGRSDRADVTYSIAMEEGIVADFMRAEGVPRANVAGWSMGGWVAMKLALDHPEMVDRLAIFDSAGVYFPATFDASLFTPTDVPGVRKLLGMLTPKPMDVPNYVAQAILRRLAENAWVVRRSVASMTGGRDLLDFRLYQIRQPMLIVWGAQDELIPIGSGETIHKAVPQSHLAAVQGCGHLAPSECSEAVLKATVEFLKSEPVQAGGETLYPATR